MPNQFCGAEIMKPFDVTTTRAEFPILAQEVHGYPLCYLDNAATSQKPRAVIEAICRYYERDNANVHRGIHELSERATAQYEAVRSQLADFIGAASASEVIYTRGATEAINLVAQSYVANTLKPGDVIVLSEMEHHANLVPWQMLAAKHGFDLRFIEVNAAGEWVLEGLPRLFADGRVKFVACNWVSNALGTINEIAALQPYCADIPLLLDACQVPAHMPMDVSALYRECGVDFVAFSSHKMFGPTGLGVLWGREALLEAMPPWQGGGDMIAHVDYDTFKVGELPLKFEAGTPAIAEVIGFGAALDWLNAQDRAGALHHEMGLLERATAGLRAIDGVQIFGEAAHKAPVISFLAPTTDLHPSDLASLLNLKGIAVRSGHHCTMPVIAKFGLPATARASFALYNTMEEVDHFVATLAAIVAEYGVAS